MNNLDEDITKHSKHSNRSKDKKTINPAMHDLKSLLGIKPGTKAPVQAWANIINLIKIYYKDDAVDKFRYLNKISKDLFNLEKNYGHDIINTFHQYRDEKITKERCNEKIESIENKFKFDFNELSNLVEDGYQDLVGLLYQKRRLAEEIQNEINTIIANNLIDGENTKEEYPFNLFKVMHEAFYYKVRIAYCINHIKRKIQTIEFIVKHRNLYGDEQFIKKHQNHINGLKKLVDNLINDTVEYIGNDKGEFYQIISDNHEKILPQMNPPTRGLMLNLIKNTEHKKTVLIKKMKELALAMKNSKKKDNTGWGRRVVHNTNTSASTAPGINDLSNFQNSIRRFIEGAVNTAIHHSNNGQGFHIDNIQGHEISGSIESDSPMGRRLIGIINNSIDEINRSGRRIGVGQRTINGIEGLHIFDEVNHLQNNIMRLMGGENNNVTQSPQSEGESVRDMPMNNQSMLYAKLTEKDKAIKSIMNKIERGLKNNHEDDITHISDEIKVNSIQDIYANLNIISGLIDIVDNVYIMGNHIKENLIRDCDTAYLNKHKLFNHYIKVIPHKQLTQDNDIIKNTESLVKQVNITTDYIEGQGMIQLYHYLLKVCSECIRVMEINKARKTSVKNDSLIKLLS